MNMMTKYSELGIPWKYIINKIQKVADLKHVETTQLRQCSSNSLETWWALFTRTTYTPLVYTISFLYPATQ